MLFDDVPGARLASVFVRYTGRPPATSAHPRDEDRRVPRHARVPLHLPKPDEGHRLFGRDPSMIGAVFESYEGTFGTVILGKRSTSRRIDAASYSSVR